MSVGIYNSVIVAGSSEYYESSVLAFQKFIQVVTVQATECCVGNTYRLGWKVQCQQENDCTRQWTRKIRSDSDADTLKSILEEVNAVSRCHSEANHNERMQYMSVVVMHSIHSSGLWTWTTKQQFRRIICGEVQQGSQNWWLPIPYHFITRGKKQQH